MAESNAWFCFRCHETHFEVPCPKERKVDVGALASIAAEATHEQGYRLYLAEHGIIGAEADAAIEQQREQRQPTRVQLHGKSLSWGKSNRALTVTCHSDGCGRDAEWEGYLLGKGRRLRWCEAPTRSREVDVCGKCVALCGVCRGFVRGAGVDTFDTEGEMIAFVRCETPAPGEHPEPDSTPSAPVPCITVHPPCPDCDDTGWYIGLNERKPCPTCRGNG